MLGPANFLRILQLCEDTNLLLQGSCTAALHLQQPHTVQRIFKAKLQPPL